MASENNSRPNSRLAQRIKGHLWAKAIDTADANSRRGDRRSPKKPEKTLLGFERPGKDRGIIQGKAQGFHRLTGQIVLREEHDPMEYTVIPVYSMGDSDALAKRSTAAQRETALAVETISSMTDVLRRAAVTREVRRIKARNWTA